MSDAYNSLGAAPADSPLPITITPEMAQALQSYQGGPGATYLLVPDMRSSMSRLQRCAGR